MSLLHRSRPGYALRVPARKRHVPVQRTLHYRVIVADLAITKLHILVARLTLVEQMPTSPAAPVPTKTRTARRIRRPATQPRAARSGCWPARYRAAATT